MKKIKAIITSNLKEHRHFEEYFKIIELIEVNETTNPDISIESSKALVEGISKTILINLDNTKTPSNIDVDDLPKVFKNAMKVLSEKCEDIEVDFVARFSSIIQVLGEIRNKRGDVSHGRMAPKAIFSSRKLASTVKNMTESMLEYVLEHYFSLDFTSDGKLDFASKEMKAYNTWLDDSLDFPIKKARYSKLLFENDVDEYESRYYDDYLPSIEEDNETVETAPEEVEVTSAKEELELIDPPAEEVEVISVKEELELMEPPVEEVVEEPAPIGKPEIETLVNTFEEETFWIDCRIEFIELFAEEENLKVEELKELINDFLFTEKAPLRGEVVNAMNEKPSLKDRAKITDELTTKITGLANELKSCGE